MKIIYLIATVCLLSSASCGQSKKNKENMGNEHKYTNHLIDESSPYLLQHAHNPVNWYPWGNEALDKAKKENKLIIVSIGYAACHWCHVMEHESFEDEEVAKFMNENFISIKVDREERPDIDQIYMNAVQLLSGRGGWPLNCIALPDGRPIYGGTYFPKDQWLEVLAKILEFSKKNPDKTEQQAKALTEGIQSSELISLNNKEATFSLKDLGRIFNNWKGNLDFVHGGNKRAPKFPMPIGYQFLLQYHFLSQNPDALKSVTTTLDKMADGGIYDQIGGGFARYSTDEIWKVPHFEKMLYDNAQLVSLYAKAFQQSNNPKYKTIVEETLTFIERELTSDEGGFYSSLDADSEGEEGKFYVWTKNEMQKVLGDNAELIMEYYNVSEKGNWEHGNNILLVSASVENFAASKNLTEDALQKLIIKGKQKLLKARSERIRPGLDDKILTSWNSLMIKGYIDAYRIFDNEDYLIKALRNAGFIIDNCMANDHRLNRNYKNGKSSINGFLDDYAFTIEAFIALYEATFDEKWLKEANELCAYTIAHFYDENSGMFFYTSDIDPSLIARKMEISDNVIPASNSQMAKNLFALGQYFYNDDFIAKSKIMLNNVKETTIESGSYYANWSILMAWFASEPYEVAIVGNDCDVKRKEFDRHYLPNVFLSGGKSEGSLTLLKNKLIEGQTTIFVCQNKVCHLPVTEVKDAKIQIMSPLR